MDAGSPLIDIGHVIQLSVAPVFLLSGIGIILTVLTNRLAPGSFVFTVGPIAKQSMVGFNGLYFSFITLSTVGYGDIVPVSSAARNSSASSTVISSTSAIERPLYRISSVSRL